MTVISIPKDYDIFLWAKKEPEVSELASAKHNQQNQVAKNPENHKIRTPQIQESSDMSCSVWEKQWAGEPEPLIQWASESVSQRPSSFFYRKRIKVCICQRCFQSSSKMLP